MELQLPSDAFVIGHVGRFEEEKNHRFLLEIIRKVVDAEPQTRLLLIGDGSLRTTIEQRAAEMGTSQKQVMFARFAGRAAPVAKHAECVCHAIGFRMSPARWH